MFCTKCGNRMPDGSKFCTKCGAPMGGEAPRGSSQVPSEGAASAGKGDGAAADPSSTPPKKKRTGLVAGVAAAVVVALAAVGIAGSKIFGGDIAENVHQFKAIMAEYTK